MTLKLTASEVSLLRYALSCALEWDSSLIDAYTPEFAAPTKEQRQRIASLRRTMKRIQRLRDIIDHETGRVTIPRSSKAAAARTA
jgi:hypothetical protein